MSMKAKILAGFGLLLAVGLVAWAVLTVPEPQPRTEEPEGPRIMSYENNVISEEKDGRKIWELTAERTEIDIDNYDTIMTGIVGRFYQENGRVVEVKSDKGLYSGESKNIKLTDGVVITSGDGAKLTSRELEWLAKEEILVASGEARVTKDDMLASGDRIESADGFNKIKVIGHAHWEKGEITAERLAEEESQQQAVPQNGGGQ